MKFWFLLIFFVVFATHLFVLQNIKVKNKTKIKDIVKITKIRLSDIVLEKKEAKVKKEILKKRVEPKEQVKKKIDPIQKPNPTQDPQKPKIVKKIKKRSKKAVKRYKKRASKHKKHIIKKAPIPQEEVWQKQEIIQNKSANKEISKKEQQKYITLVRELIKQNLFYPRLAKRMHIEGVVHISFVVKKSGEVTDIAVLSASNSLLKKGAIKTINSISPPPFPFGLGRDRLELSIPIEFRLKE